MQQRIALLLFFVLLSFIGNSQLIIQNSTSKDIAISIGWYSNTTTYSGFITKGWYLVKPGEKKNVGLTFTSGENTFYYFAKQKQGNKWEGNYKMLVNSSAFEIINADKQFTKDNDSSSYWALFSKKTVSFGILETKTYTLNFTENQESSTASNFNLVGTFEYKQTNFESSIKLYSNDKKDYKIEMDGASASCILQFESEGFFDPESKELIFTQDGCKLKFVFTENGNLKLTVVNGESCSNFHGASCDFYLVTYTKK